MIDENYHSLLLLGDMQGELNCDRKSHNIYIMLEEFNVHLNKSSLVQEVRFYYSN